MKRSFPLNMKPTTKAMLQNVTDKYYPQMFLPSTLIMLMAETKRKRYSIKTHEIKLDLSGNYLSMNIRFDIKDWIVAHRKKLGKKYEEKYGVAHYTDFTAYFIANVIESKNDAQINPVILKRVNLNLLQTEYKKRKSKLKKLSSFEQFTDMYIDELLVKIREMREIMIV